MTLPEYVTKEGLDHFDLYIDADRRTGFHGELFMRFQVNGNFPVQPEVFYSTKGTNINHYDKFQGILIIEGKT